MKSEHLLQAVQVAAAQMHGAFALGVIHQQKPLELVAIRKGSPLVLGEGIGENFIASDALALRSFAQSVYYLEEGDSALLTPKKISIYDAKGILIKRESHHLSSDSEVASKGPYRHFMLKEIFEQPTVLSDTLEGRVTSHEVFAGKFW